MSVSIETELFPFGTWGERVPIKNRKRYLAEQSDSGVLNACDIR